MTAVRLTWSFTRSAAAGMIVALMLAAAVPVIFGGRSFTVMSGSMEPSISTGDLVITKAISPRDAATGDVVTFNDPEKSGRMITHRVATAAPEGASYSFVTKGDANRTTERWSVPADGRIGQVVFRLPKLGYVLAFSRSPEARILLVTIPAVLLAGFALISIWRPRRKEAPDVPAAA